MDVEQRARGVFAQWHADKGCSQRVVRDCRNGVIQMDALTSELLRIALTPPEGFVLVPVEPTELMQRAAIKTAMACSWTEAQECHEFERILSDLCDGYRAMLAARPEMKP